MGHRTFRGVFRSFVFTLRWLRLKANRAVFGVSETLLFFFLGGVICIFLRRAIRNIHKSVENVFFHLVKVNYPGNEAYLDFFVKEAHLAA